MKKMILDVVMTIMMVLLMCLNFTGLQIHEIMGIAIFFFFLIHNFINFKWIKAVTLNFKKSTLKTKIMYIINILLFISTSATVITGILISKTILTEIKIPNTEFLNGWHTSFAYWSLIIIAVHIGVHWKSILNKLMTVIKVSKDNILIKIVLRVIYIAIAISAIYSLIKGDFANKLIPFGKINSKDNNTNSNINQASSTLVVDDSTDSGNTDNNSTSNTTSTSSEAPTISEFLGNLHCTGCGRHCLLTSPQCNIGVEYQTEKVAEYNETYGTNETYTSTSSKNLNGSMQQGTRPEKPSGNFENRSNLANESFPSGNTAPKESNQNSELISTVSIMSFVVGGTYYISEYVENRKNKNKNKKNEISNEIES